MAMLGSWQCSWIRGKRGVGCVLRLASTTWSARLYCSSGYGRQGFLIAASSSMLKHIGPPPLAGRWPACGSCRLGHDAAAHSLFGKKANGWHMHRTAAGVDCRVAYVVNANCRRQARCDHEWSRGSSALPSLKSPKRSSRRPLRGSLPPGWSPSGSTHPFCRSWCFPHVLELCSTKSRALLNTTPSSAPHALELCSTLLRILWSSAPHGLEFCST